MPMPGELFQVLADSVGMHRGTVYFVRLADLQGGASGRRAYGRYGSGTLRGDCHGATAAPRNDKCWGIGVWVRTALLAAAAFAAGMLVGVGWR